MAVWYYFPIQKVHKHVWGTLRVWDDQATSKKVRRGVDLWYIASVLYAVNRFRLVDFNMDRFNFW